MHVASYAEEALWEPSTNAQGDPLIYKRHQCKRHFTEKYVHISAPAQDRSSETARHINAQDAVKLPAACLMTLQDNIVWQTNKQSTWLDFVYRKCNKSKTFESHGAPVLQLTRYTIL